MSEILTCAICKNQYRRLVLHLIKKHNMTEAEYKNQYPDSQMSIPFSHTEDTKNKMSGPREHTRGRKTSDEHKRKLSEIAKQRKRGPHKQETLKKMQDSWVKRKADTEKYEKYIKETRERMSTEEMKIAVRNRTAKMIIEGNHNGKSKDTSLERRFMKWATAHGLVLEQQFPLQTYKGTFTFDFILKDRNLLIETDGEYWHTKSHEVINRDIIKGKLAASLGYTVLRISDRDWKPEVIFESDEVIVEHTNKILEKRLLDKKNS